MIKNPTIQDWDQRMEKATQKDQVFPTICIMMVATISWIRETCLQEDLNTARVQWWCLTIKDKQITGELNRLVVIETIFWWRKTFRPNSTKSSRLLTIQNKLDRVTDSSHKRVSPQDIDNSVHLCQDTSRTQSNSKLWLISSTSCPWKDTAKHKDHKMPHPDHQEIRVLKRRRCSHNFFSTSRIYSNTIHLYKWTPSTISFQRFLTWPLLKKVADILKTTRDLSTSAQLFIWTLASSNLIMLIWMLVLIRPYLSSLWLEITSSISTLIRFLPKLKLIRLLSRYSLHCRQLTHTGKRRPRLPKSKDLFKRKWTMFLSWSAIPHMVHHNNKSHQILLLKDQHPVNMRSLFQPNSTREETPNNFLRHQLVNKRPITSRTHSKIS